MKSAKTRRKIGKTRKRHSYTSLGGADKIRVLILEPAKDEAEPIYLSFQEGRYKDLEGGYEAISYTWGEPNLAYSLHFDDGTHILVTANLNLVLRRLRYPDKERLLWADAVCINQSDDEEKAMQIPFMVQIFRGASRVLAWLGAGVQEQRGLHALQRWSRYQGKTEMRKQPQSLSEQVGINTEIPKPTSAQRLSVRQRTLQSVVELLQLPWFSRLWIIQEVVFNLDLVLIYGDMEISWIRFVAALHSLRDGAEEDLESLVRAHAAIQLVIELWKWNSGFEKKQHGDSRLGIMRLLRTFGGYSCTDGRDRLFALFSMAHDIIPSNAMPSRGAIYMDIDYSLDVRAVFERFAVACLLRDVHSPFRQLEPQGLEPHECEPSIFNTVPERQFSGVTDDWPSWVPDWSKGPTVHQRMVEHLSLNFERTLPKSLIVISTTCLTWGRPISRPAEWRLPTVITKIETLEDKIESLSQNQLANNPQNPTSSLSAVLELYQSLRRRITKGAANSPEFVCQLLTEVWPPPDSIDVVRDYLHSTTKKTYADFSKYISTATSHANFFLAAIHGATFLGFGVKHLVTNDKLLPFSTFTPSKTYHLDGSIHSDMIKDITSSGYRDTRDTHPRDSDASHVHRRTKTWEVQDLHHALVVRPVSHEDREGTHDSSKDETYRLVGTACLVGPFWKENDRHADGRVLYHPLRFRLA